MLVMNWRSDDRNDFPSRYGSGCHVVVDAWSRGERLATN
jgi:hypothetical protein